MIGKLAVPVGETFPWIDCRQLGWAQRGHVPLDRGQIGHSGHADPAVTPGLPSQPRDEIAAVLGLALATVTKFAFRIPAAARIGVDDRIAVLTPIGGIGCLETGVTGDPARSDIGFRPYQAFRRVVFSVGTPSEKDWQTNFIMRAVRAVDVHEYTRTVAQRHGYVAFDVEAVLTNLGIYRRRRNLLSNNPLRRHAWTHDELHFRRRIR